MGRAAGFRKVEPRARVGRRIITRAGRDDEIDWIEDVGVIGILPDIPLFISHLSLSHLLVSIVGLTSSAEMIGIRDEAEFLPFRI